MLSAPGRARRIGQHLLLLHISGRRTGRRLVFPVAYRPTGDGRLMVLTNSAWRVNLRGGTPVELTFLGSRRRGHAVLVEDPESVALVYHSVIKAEGYTKAGRRMGIRINVPRMPTLGELEEAVRRDGLSVVYLDLDGPRNHQSR